MSNPLAVLMGDKSPTSAPAPPSKPAPEGQYQRRSIGSSRSGIPGAGSGGITNNATTPSASSMNTYAAAGTPAGALGSTGAVGSNNSYSTPGARSSAGNTNTYSTSAPARANPNPYSGGSAGSSNPTSGANPYSTAGGVINPYASNTGMTQPNNAHGAAGMAINMTQQQQSMQHQQMTMQNQMQHHQLAIHQNQLQSQQMMANQQHMVQNQMQNQQMMMQQQMYQQQQQNPYMQQMQQMQLPPPPPPPRVLTQSEKDQLCLEKAMSPQPVKQGDKYVFPGTNKEFVVTNQAGGVTAATPGGVAIPAAPSATATDAAGSGARAAAAGTAASGTAASSTAAAPDAQAPAAGQPAAIQPQVLFAEGQHQQVEGLKATEYRNLQSGVAANILQDLPPSIAYMVDAYRKIDPKAVSAKIEAVQTLCNQKVKGLMRSIDKLQKENGELKKNMQEHKRSAAFKKLESELGKQDAIIQGLLGKFTKNKGEGKKIVEEILSGGPPRVKVMTRQELIFENDQVKKSLAVERGAKKAMEQNLKNMDAECSKHREVAARMECQLRDVIEDMQDIQVKKELMRQEKIDLELRLQQEFEGTIRALAEECEHDKLRVAHLENQLSDETRQKELMEQVKRFAEDRRKQEREDEENQLQIAELEQKVMELENSLKEERKAAEKLKQAIAREVGNISPRARELVEEMSKKSPGKGSREATPIQSSRSDRPSPLAKEDLSVKKATSDISVGKGKVTIQFQKADGSSPQATPRDNAAYAGAPSGEGGRVSGAFAGRTKTKHGKQQDEEANEDFGSPVSFGKPEGLPNLNLPDSEEKLVLMEKIDALVDIIQHHNFLADKRKAKTDERDKAYKEERSIRVSSARSPKSDDVDMNADGSPGSARPGNSTDQPNLSSDMVQAVLRKYELDGGTYRDKYARAISEQATQIKQLTADNDKLQEKLKEVQLELMDKTETMKDLRETVKEYRERVRELESANKDSKESSPRQAKSASVKSDEAPFKAPPSSKPPSSSGKADSKAASKQPSNVPSKQSTKEAAPSKQTSKDAYFVAAASTDRSVEPQSSGNSADAPFGAAPTTDRSSNPQFTGASQDAAFAAGTATASGKEPQRIDSEASSTRDKETVAESTHREKETARDDEHLEAVEHSIKLADQVKDLESRLNEKHRDNEELEEENRQLEDDLVATQERVAELQQTVRMLKSMTTEKMKG